MHPAILFDDSRGVLAPLTDLRPAWSIRTGAFTTLERFRRVLKLDVVGVHVHPELAALARELTDLPINQGIATTGPILFINSRCAIAPSPFASLDPGEWLFEAGSGDVIAGLGDASDLGRLLSGKVPAAQKSQHLPAPALLSRPWHIKTFRDRCLAADLALFARYPTQTDLPGVTTIVGPSRPGLSLGPLQRAIIHPTAKVYPTATFDIEHGPVVIDENATVRPGALIIGPAYIGPHSTVIDKAIIRPQTAIGPHCKVAGEVGGTIFQGFANKAHDGHLGDSYIGEWANLGAGTLNSNLLNTYAEVIAKPSPAASNERTGEQFLGCIVGDHVKFAINTRIMTGSIIHTGTMWAASAPVTGHVPAFSWATDAGIKPFRFDKFMEIARTAMARRKVEPTQAYTERLRVLADRRA